MRKRLIDSLFLFLFLGEILCLFVKSSSSRKNSLPSRNRCSRNMGICPCG
nr:MAG TPA: Big defensin [Caudoviricetes sp.]